ncbi:MAG: bifunctional (p)ppGpp synthetase/guanosine-3',5'-bis(diphosphate) 3'-pyrophosphohydrolase [Clostridia bacterium]|nr:bifunctional (p)ppGpp synthetase/guanosine-3',5'-bis(diphosphate) 3'-pyrophosphohydrolase [Clostridia bacterium]
MEEQSELKLKEQLLNDFRKKFGIELGEKMREAVEFAERVHCNQRRDAGDAYVTHPMTVSIYLLKMGMDAPTVIAGVLHDTVEDGDGVKIEDIEALFGKEVASLVDGVTKLTKSGNQTYITKKQEQTENLRKLFLSIASDVRVVIIKLADRLHNMRTLAYCTPEKQARKAKETMEVYAPLADRFGMGVIRSELEDLSFAYLMPEEYRKLKEEVSVQQKERMEALSTAMEKMKVLLKEADIKGDISGRPKHLYSTYRKMQRNNYKLNELYDLIAIRIIVETVNDCYAALGVVHATWKPLPGRFKDYIAMPKPNMYRSLHTTVMSENSIPFEIQIRTREMHETAEYGIAAHWMYKDDKKIMTELDQKTSLIKQIIEADETTEDSKEFVENVLKDFLGEYVFVLTPQGEIIDLPVGSTPLDFAYRIHTNVGHHCQHARVNGNMVRLDYKLKTNDVVEIITSNSQIGPRRDWLNIVKTQSARNKIRQWFKRENREENVQRGREMLEETAKRHAQNLQILLKPEYINEIIKRMTISSLEDLYATIGYGGISAGQVLHKLMDCHRKEMRLEEMNKKLEEAGKEPHKPTAHTIRNGIYVHGDPGMAVFFANCCNPLPGDPIIGYITRGRGISVHRADCKNAENLLRDQERIIEVEWAEEENSTFSASIRVVVVDKAGSLMAVSKVLTNLNVNMTSLRSRIGDEGSAIFEMSFSVTGTEQLKIIIANLKKLPEVIDVYRT